MSVGPSALSSVLVQRLDAVLGTQLAQQGVAGSPVRADAVQPTGAPAGVGDDRGSGVQQGAARPGDRAAIREAAERAEAATAARARFVSTDTTRSAPTSLGQTARTILTLLAQYPETAPAVAGRTPLWLPEGGDASRPGTAPAHPRPSGDPQRAVNAVGQRGDEASDAATRQGAAGRVVSAATAATAATAAAGAAAPQQAGATASRAGMPAVGTAVPAGAAPAALPPLAGAGPQPAQLAQALHHALQVSGLFYESHLNALAHGRRSRAQVAREPQSALDPQAAPRLNPVGEQRSILADNVRYSLPTAAAPALPQADGLPASGTAPTWSSAQPAQQPAPPPGIHPEATLLVRQQLEVLANQTLAWQGTAWPDAPMWWEIRRDDAHDPAAAQQTDASSSWSTRVVLSLPRLGPVEARLSLAGDQLVMHLVAPESQAALAGAGAALRARMEAAGLTLSGLSVTQYAPGLEELP